MRISIIAAMDRNQVIGKNGHLPWYISSDLANFRKVTMGKPIVMGRKTHESIGKHLSGRENIILTKNKNYQTKDCTVLNSLIEIFEHCKEAEEIMITGGAEIYQLTLDKATHLYLTEVHTEIVGDTFFPKFNKKHWVELSRADHKADEKNEYDYSFVVLKRR